MTENIEGNTNPMVIYVNRPVPEYIRRAKKNYRQANKEKFQQWTANYKAKQLEKHGEEYKAKVKEYNKMYYERKKQEREQAKLLASVGTADFPRCT